MDRREFLRLTGASIAALALRPALVAARPSALVSGQQAIVTTDSLNVRGGPSTNQPLVGRFAQGTAVDLLGVNGAWWRVASDQAVGYVDGAYLEPTGDPSANNVFDLDLTLPYSRQLTAIWCDPADLEMWLGYHGRTDDAASYARQQAIWNWELSHNAGFTQEQWDCSPFAVASAAHQWMPDLGFEHFIYDDPMDGTRMMAWLLANPDYQEPSIALIWKGAHYIVIRGVRAIGDPAADPQGAQILGFYIADPNRGSPSWMGEDRFLPLDTWLGSVFTPTSYLTANTGIPGDVWQGKFVAIQRTVSSDGPTLSGTTGASPTNYI